MEIISSIHGKIEYEEKDILKFEKGIPGFDNLKKFIIKTVEDSTFLILQSIEDSNVGFVLISPFEVEEKYEIKINEDLVKRLEIEEANQVALYSIVTLNSKAENITANLKAPLVINVKSKKGEQFIVDKEQYKTKHPLKKG